MCTCVRTESLDLTESRDLIFLMKDSLDRKDLLKLCDLPCAEWLSGPKDTECLRPMALTGIVETSLCLGLVGQLCVLLSLAIELPDCPSSAQL